MEKKQTKKTPAPKKKAAPAKKKIVKKAINVEIPLLAPEATPFVFYSDVKEESKVSFLDKVKKFLGF
jgi:hypothetical protein